MRRNCRTAFLKESFTDMYGHGEIHLVSVFCFFLMDAYMWGNGFTEIIHNNTCVYLLFYIFRLRGNTYKIVSAPVPVPKNRYYVTDRSGKRTIRYYSDVPVTGNSIICCDTSATNEYHTTILTKYSGHANYLKDTDRLAYIRFLKEGPMYADPLLRLLGISDKPVRESLCDKGHAKLIKLSNQI